MIRQTKHTIHLCFRPINALFFQNCAVVYAVNMHNLSQPETNQKPTRNQRDIQRVKQNISASFVYTLISGNIDSLINENIDSLINGNIDSLINESDTIHSNVAAISCTSLMYVVFRVLNPYMSKHCILSCCTSLLNSGPLKVPEQMNRRSSCMALMSKFTTPSTSTELSAFKKHWDIESSENKSSLSLKLPMLSKSAVGKRKSSSSMRMISSTLP